MDPQQKSSSDTTTNDSSKNPWFDKPAIRLLIRGLLISLPLIILLFVVWLMFDLILGILTPFSSFISPGSEDPHWFFHLISFLILVGIFYFVGLSSKHRITKRYLLFIEKKYLFRIPLYSSLRDLIQQFSGMKQMPFSEVVLIDVFNSGVLMTGMITEQVTEDLYTVFVPTAPNPTNGNIYHVPKAKLIFVNVTTEAAMRTIVGMGTGSTCLFTEDQIKTITDGDSVSN